MRPRWVLLLALWAGSLVGCVTGEPERSTALLDRVRAFQGPASEDVVQMDVALLERPLGDHYINQDLWALTDEQVIDLDHKAVLEDNGFRVGQVGAAPPGLLDLLTSERSCVNPHRLQLHADTAKTLPVGPALARCSFELHQDGRQVPVNLERAECALKVVPFLTRDGRTRLHFTPQVRHGDTVLMPQPAADRSGWVREEHRPTEDYASLGWDVSLAPNEYVIIGTRFDRPGTMGYQYFWRGDEPAPVQRLLVIRTSRPTTELAPDTAPEGEAEDSPRSSPLALQPSW